MIINLTTGKPAEGRILSGFGKQNIEMNLKDSEIVAYFFSERCPTKPSTHVICKKRNQSSNLYHLSKKDHADWRKDIEVALQEKTRIFATKDFKKAENVCNWIEFIIEANLPFTIVKMTN